MKPPGDATTEAGASVPPPRSAPETTPSSDAAPQQPDQAALETLSPGSDAKRRAVGLDELDELGPDPDPTTGDAGDDHVTGGTGDELTERERDILAFERQWWRHAGAKEQAIRDRFGLSATRYYQLLNGLLDRPAALAAEPLLVGRLRRLRYSRARNRRLA